MDRNTVPGLTALWKKQSRRGLVALGMLCALALAGCGKQDVQQQTPGAQGRWNGISSYVESQREACREVTYITAEKDGSAGKEATAAVAATKLLEMDKQGEVTGLADEGVLEIWDYGFLTKLDIKDPDRVFLVGWQYRDEEGFFELTGQGSRVLIALRYPDGTYDILHDQSLTESGADFYGYRHTPEEALYDWYIQEKGLELPAYALDAGALSGTGNFPIHRYDGPGFYLYIPTYTWYWDEPQEGKRAQRWRWYHAYENGSAFQIDYVETAPQAAAEDLQAKGASAAGGQTWSLDLGDLHQRWRIVPAADGGSWRLHSTWTDGGLAQEGEYTADDPKVMEKMMDSFLAEDLAETAPKAVAAGTATQCPGVLFKEVTESGGAQERKAQIEVRVTVCRDEGGTYIRDVTEVLARNVSGWAEVSLGAEADLEDTSFAKDRRSAVMPVTYHAKDGATAQSAPFTATVRLGVEDLARPDANALTEEELEPFRRRLAPGLDGAEVDPLVCFLSSEYADVREMDFAEFLRCFAQIHPHRPLTGEELDALKALDTWPYGPDAALETLSVSLKSIAAAELDACLQAQAGIGVGDLKDASGADYLEETDCYYIDTADAALPAFACVSGRRDGALVHLTLAPDSGDGIRYRLTLRQTEEGGHQVVSFQPVT